LSQPLTVRQTDTYARWFAALRDQRAKARIDTRIRRLELGNAGGDKSSQQRDISEARTIAETWKAGS
jgi:putative component of toxin-antitoxin plasmid stabilization module